MALERVYCLGDCPKRDELKVRREDRGGRWGMGCKEEGRGTKRTGELLMRAQPEGWPLVLMCTRPQ